MIEIYAGLSRRQKIEGVAAINNRAGFFTRGSSGQRRQHQTRPATRRGTVNLGNRAAGKPTPLLIDFTDAAPKNFPRPFLTPFKDMAQSIDDLSFDLFFCDCVHFGVRRLDGAF